MAPCQGGKGDGDTMSSVGGIRNRGECAQYCGRFSRVLPRPNEAEVHGWDFAMLFMREKWNKKRSGKCAAEVDRGK